MGNNVFAIHWNVNAKEMAKKFNYSERQIQRLIQIATGLSFRENVLQLKNVLCRKEANAHRLWDRTVGAGAWVFQCGQLPPGFQKLPRHDSLCV